MEVEDALGAGISGQSSAGAVDDGGRRRGGRGDGRGVDLDVLGVGVGAAACGLYGEGDGIATGGVVVMADGLPSAIASVTEGPLVAVDLVAGGGAGELHGVALADVVGGEVGIG